MSDTIVAVATPFGPGAIAVLRVSGTSAHMVAGKALCGAGGAEIPVRKSLRAKVCDGNGLVLDDVLVTFFCGPASYTGEDTVEISCHGGVLVTQRILERLIECGARAARAGEFSLRAFLNGKMDLTQAEAVMDVISAQSDLSLRAAQQQLAGRLGQATERLRSELLDVVAHVEAFIDFPEEDIDPRTGKALTDQIEACEGRIAKLLATAEQGRILREGVRTVICGEPNVGKSSLLNVLLDDDRAIVSPVAGTTRDTVEEVVNLAGIPVRLIDTAGIRPARDEIERHGVAKTRRKLLEADLILEVMDVSRRMKPGLTSKDVGGRHHIRVLNKIDQGEHPCWGREGGVRTSCTSGVGVDTLLEAIRTEVSLGVESWGQEAVAVNARHQACLRRARVALAAGKRSLEAGESTEFGAQDLREALEAVGEITGRVEAEELLGVIFGRFCVGK